MQHVYFIIIIVTSVVVACAVKAGAPGNLTVNDVGPHSMELSWSKPRNDGGSPIKGTTVTPTSVPELNGSQHCSVVSAVAMTSVIKSRWISDSVSLRGIEIHHPMSKIFF